jgi:hypothetical protein
MPDRPAAPTVWDELVGLAREGARGEARDDKERDRILARLDAVIGKVNALEDELREIRWEVEAREAADSGPP